MKSCPTCGSWIPNGQRVGVGAGFGQWDLESINWLEVIAGAALGAFFGAYFGKKVFR